MENNKISAVVVGAGPSILGSNLGETIDNFDVVIRCNNFEIEGFEKDVGKKTDIWAVNTSRSTAPRDYTAFKEIWFKDQPAHKLLQKLSYNQDALEICRMISDPREYCKSLELNGIKIEPGENPSLGFRAILMAISEYGSVHIAGFDFFEGSEDKKFFKHYYTDSGKWAAKAQTDYYQKWFLEMEWAKTKEERDLFKEAIDKNLMVVRSAHHDTEKEKLSVEKLINQNKVFLLGAKDEKLFEKS